MFLDLIMAPKVSVYEFTLTIVGLAMACNNHPIGGLAVTVYGFVWSRIYREFFMGKQ